MENETRNKEIIGNNDNKNNNKDLQKKNNYWKYFSVNMHRKNNSLQ